jgi:phage gp29-like protein
MMLSEQYLRIGGGLTPRQVSAIMREADSGYVYRLVDLANESRQKDCHVQALLHTRESALSGLPWSVTPAVPYEGYVPTERDKEVSYFVESALKNAEGNGERSRGFTDLLSHLAGGIYFGYAVAEIDYEISDGKIVPSGFTPISPRRFRFSLDSGTLLWWDQFGMLDGVNLPTRYPDKFLQHQPRVNGDVPAREGLVRVLMWAALFRNWAMADWMRLAELAYKPWRIGRYKSTASTKDIEDMVDALERLTSNGVATFSDRADVQIEWPERGRGGKPEHHDLSEFLGMEMSKCVLGQTLTVEQGERGARSLGEVHDRVRKDIRESDSVAMAATVRRDLIEPLVRLNYGPDQLVPWFEFVTEDAVDLGALSRAIEGLVRAGLDIPQWWVRDRAGIAAPGEGDELLRGQDFIDSEGQEPDADEPGPDDGEGTDEYE